MGTSSRKFYKRIPFNFYRSSIYKEFPWEFFFTGKSFVKFFLLILWRNSLVNWSGTSSRKFYKRIPFNFDRSSFYKEFPWKFFFTGKSFVKFFPIFKLESDFFPHFLSKIRKLENCENLFILNYNWANFQRNRRQKNSSSSSRCSSRSSSRSSSRCSSRITTYEIRYSKSCFLWSPLSSSIARYEVRLYQSYRR